MRPDAILGYITVFLRRLRTEIAVLRKAAFLTRDTALHIGKGTRLWAPCSLTIDSHVYIGKHINIEANYEMSIFKFSIGLRYVGEAARVVTANLAPYCVAAGVPAHALDQRFAGLQTIAVHEQAISNGPLRFSERGYDHCQIEPAASTGKSVL